MGPVVIISANSDTLDVCAAYFRQHNYSIRPFQQIHEYLNLQTSAPITPSLILIDQENLRDSQTLPSSLENLFHGVPIIILGHDVDPASPISTHAHYPHVPKPINFPQLHTKVEQLIHPRGSDLATMASVRDMENFPQPVEPQIIAESASFRKVIELARTVAPTQANVFISGESGTGKEIIARLIHSYSPRTKNSFVAINCSAIPETLLESELFGYAKGSFTGASHDKSGLFEEAHGGTLFLDEIGDMNLSLQAKLLRVLQDKKIKRVGENHLREVDVRIISATHKDLRREIQENRFREDVFFRLNVIPIHIPPLRERPEDIIPMAEYFLRRYRAINNRPPGGFSPEAKKILVEREWKGNVRELENTIERAVVLARNEIITPTDINIIEETSAVNPISDFSTLVGQLSQDRPLTIDRLIKIYIKHVLQKNKGAKEKTARELDIDRKTLYRKLQEMQSENLL